MQPDHTSRRFSWRNLSWLTLGLGLLALATFLEIASRPSYYYPMPLRTGGGMHESQGAPASEVGSKGMAPARDTSVTYPDPYPYPGQTPPATDTREFLKVTYGAEMLTRDAPALTRRVETTVRGHEGRVDQQSSSAKFGYVSFVVPLTKYEAFRTELESLVGKRFLAVHVNSSNLLPEKQSIEEQQKQADSALAGYQAARTKLVTAHTAAVKELQAQIDAEDDQNSSAATLLKAQLASENSSYAKKLATADANIKYGQDWQKAIQTQDKALLDNVATVSGTVSIRWISLWEALQLYLPGYWVPGILAFLTLLSAVRDRRRFMREA